MCWVYVYVFMKFTIFLQLSRLAFNLLFFFSPDLHNSTSTYISAVCGIIKRLNEQLILKFVPSNTFQII